MNIIEPQIISPNELSAFGPKIEEGLVLRTALIDTINDLIESGEDLIVVTGLKGTGKTTLLTQFFTLSENPIAIFLKVTNRNSYNEDIIAFDIYRQAYFYVNGMDCMDCEPNIDSREIHEIFYKLNVLLKKQCKFINIIIDGLSDIPISDKDSIDSIINMLPLSYDRIRVILSSDNEKITESIPYDRIKRIEMVLLSKHEAQDLFTNLNSEQVSEIVDTFRGNPEKLISIKRLLSNGTSFSEITQLNSVGTKDLFQEEWNLYKNSIDEKIEILAAISFSISELTTKQLSEITETSEEYVFSYIKKIGFLRISKSGKVEFVSNLAREYSKNKLKNHEIEIKKKLVLYLTGKAKNIHEINNYLMSMKDYPRIIEHVTPENISLLLKQSKCINTAVGQLKIGKQAAKELNDNESLLKYSMTQSMLSGISTSKILKSELRCHLTEGDYDLAFSLASSSNNIEEKLHLLSVIAKHQKFTNECIEDRVFQEVERCYEKIDASNLSESRAIEIAAELFICFPEKALKIIDSISSLKSAGGNKADFAFYIMAAQALKSDPNSIEKFIDNIPQEENEKKEALSIIGLFRAGTPADVILKKIESFDDPGNSIFILKAWINRFPESIDNYLLVKKILSLILSTTEYHANATLYAELINTVKHCSQKYQREFLLDITSKLDSLKKSGPTLDYIKILIGMKEIKHPDFPIPEEDIMSQIDSINDLSVKLAAHCLICANKAIENIEKVIENKNKIFDVLIRKTAEHVTILKSAFEIECSYNFRNALKWADMLNTRPRRDHAIYTIIKKSCDSKSDSTISMLCEAVRKIKNIDLKNRSISNIMKFSKSKETISKNDFLKLVKLRNRVKNNVSRSHINIQLLEIEFKNWPKNYEASSIKEDLENSWAHIDGDWDKLDIAYEIHNSTLKFDKKIALKYKSEAQNLRSSNLTNDKKLIDTYVLSIDLIIRSIYFSGKINQISDKEEEQLINLIEQIENKSIKSKCYSRFASALYLNEDNRRFNNIVESRIIPIIESFDYNYKKELYNILYWTGPIILVYSTTIFDKKMELVDDYEELCDSILESAHRFLINRVLLNDPFSPVKNHSLKIHTKDLETHYEIIKRINEDSRVYLCIERLTNIFHRGKKSHTYSKTQIDSLITHIDYICENKFDNEDFVKHDGYKICCKALKLKLQAEKKLSVWKSLVDELGCIPVESDKVVILGEIISCMPNNRDFTLFKKQLLKEASELIEIIPSNLDRLSRYEYLAEVGQDVDKQFVKQFIRKAILLSTAEDDDAYQEKRLSLIDSVFSMDEDFAAGLSALYDDDPARKKIIERNIEESKIEKDKISNLDVSKEKIGEKKLSNEYPNLFWNILGRMNANNYVNNSYGSYANLIEQSSFYNLDDAYPIISYYIHSIGNTAKNHSAMQKKLEPLKDSLFNCAIFHSESLFVKNRIYDKEIRATEQVIFKKDEYQRVLDFIYRWNEEHVSTTEKELVIIDPYFCIEDLEFIGKVINCDPNYQIKILTSLSRKSHVSTGDNSITDSVELFWRDNINSTSRPFIDITFCGIPKLSNTMPIHDRWWLSSSSGLRLGGSINGFMGERISSISKMKTDETIDVENKISGYLDRKTRLYEGERINYETYSI